MAQRYDTYKDSGVQWLGEIPGHWDCVKLKTVVSKIESGTSVNGSTSQFANKSEYGVLKTGAVSFRVFNPLQNKLVEGAEKQRLSCPVTKNTIIVSRMNTPELVGSCAIVEKDYPNLFLPDRLWQVHFKDNANIKYLHWILNGHYVRTRYAAICVGSSSTMQNISQGQFLETKITLPSLPEQNSIVSYLDDKCGKIDKMLEGKQKQIELLAEMKQRIIADAVTRGLNPDVKMKATNIPWLPEIPEHWEMTKVSSHFKQRNEKVSDKDYPALSVSKQGVTPQLANVALSNAEGSSRKLVKVGDYAVNSRSDRKGSCGVSKYEGSVSLITIVLEPFNIDGDYVHYLFRSNPWIEEFYRNGRGIVADLWTTNYQMMKSMYMPIPPRSEQHAIVSFIKEKEEKIDALTSKLQQEIESIKEYKQRLISDVVTGQIKVC